MYSNAFSLEILGHCVKANNLTGATRTRKAIRGGREVIIWCSRGVLARNSRAPVHTHFGRSLIPHSRDPFSTVIEAGHGLERAHIPPTSVARLNAAPNGLFVVARRVPDFGERCCCCGAMRRARV